MRPSTPCTITRQRPGNPADCCRVDGSNAKIPEAMHSPDMTQLRQEDRHSPVAVRHAFRAGYAPASTVGLAPGFVQANLVVLPRAAAADFLAYCHRNPKPCPLIGFTEAGDP